VLPAPHRLTRGDDLRRVSRRGRRSGSETLVVHLLTPDPVVAEAEEMAGDRAAAQTRAGFVVGRAVGSSVLRHRVQRRLRHLCRDRLDRLPRGSELVVRALPSAGEATYQELGADLDRCLVRALAGEGDVGRHVGRGTVS
jgi:ribonuclease P protein component